MVEKLILLSSDPFVERGNLLVIFECNDEPSNLIKMLQQRYSKISEQGVYSFYQIEKAPVILSIKIDPSLVSTKYEELFLFYFESLSQNYGKSLIFALPEGENFQSIAVGFLNICKNYVENDFEIKIYVENTYTNIVKPFIEKLHARLYKKQLIKSFLMKSTSCSECDKFCYVPFKKSCCKAIICSRCGFRDKTHCSSCGVEITNLVSFDEFKEICSQAPYLCKCGLVLNFSSVASHIQNCYASEVECRVCNEMTKLSNFIAHMRMCHMDRLKKDIELI